MSTSSPFATLGNIFVSPAQAFDDIRSHNRWLWWPLLITIAVTAAFTTWYFATIDIHWFMLQSLQSNPMLAGKISAEQMQQMADQATRTSPLISGVVGTILGLPIAFALFALYYFFAAKLAGYEVQGYGSWYSFVIWSSFPGIVGTLVSALMYFMRSGNQVPLQNIDLTSLNTLLIHLAPADSWYTLISSLHLTTFWVIGLTIFGLARWAKRGLGHAAFVVLLPYVVIYGVWILIKVL